MNKQKDNKYGKEIRSIRAYLGKTQAEMAADLGITAVTLSNYERGVSVPDVILWDLINEMRGFCGK